jgi:multiple sugar transport system substrate-binding protein
MRKMVTDEAMLVTSVDTQGPRPDIRPGKVFEAFVMPEMIQDKLIKGMSSTEAVERAAARMRQLVN